MFEIINLANVNNKSYKGMQIEKWIFLNCHEFFNQQLITNLKKIYIYLI